MPRKNFYLSQETIERLESAAQSESTSMSLLVEKALLSYFDTMYMEKYAGTIPEDILKSFEAQTALMENRLNNKTNKLISELAIQLGILQMVISNNLDVNPEFVEQARIRMVEYLKTNNRVFRLSGLIDDTEV